jgi:hypothetical protein
MSVTLKWTSLSSYTTVIAGAATAPTLKALANNGQKISNEIDSTSTRLMYADFDLLTKFGTNPSAGGYVAMYFIQSVDGTNYADGDDSVAPPASAWVGNFPVRAVTTAQRVALRNILIPATKFKVLLVNKSGQAMSNVDNENVLSYRPYSEIAE